jgi:hypothetical protein
MAHGFKTGGRRRGSKNKKRGLSDLNDEAVVQSVQSGETPLEYMLRIMRDPTQAVKRRDEMARAAAPYIHARLMAAKMEPKPEKNLADLSRQELKARMIRRMVQWGLIPPLTEEQKKAFAEEGVIIEPIEEEEDPQSRFRRVSSPRHPPRDGA